MGGVVSSMEHLDTLPKRLQYLSEEDPNKELYVFYNDGVRDAYTSRELFTLAGRFAHRIRQQGFQKGDVIANTLPNSPERLITDVGIVMAGCVTMNGQVLLADGSDVFRSAKVARCRAVLVSDEGPGWRLIQRFLSKEAQAGCLFPLDIVEAPEMKSAIVISRGDPHFLDDIRNGSKETFVSPSEPEDLMIVLTTSGSTGYSKLVPRCHQDIISQSLMHSQLRSPDLTWPKPSDKRFVYYSDRMMGWTGGISFYSLCQADTRVLQDLFHAPRDTASELWRAVEAENCEVCGFLPLELENVLERLRTSGRLPVNRKLKTIITGGQPIRKSQLQSFFTLAETVFLGYGSTEVPCVTRQFLKEETFESYNCGKVLDGLSVKICRDDGEECQVNEIGTLFVRGFSVFRGYFNQLENPNPQNQKAFTPDGWFNTEDYGYFDEADDLYVLGRVKDVIMYGAFVFYPGWMERKLLEHPDVLEAIIVPVTDPVLYHNICACIKLRQDSGLDEDKLKDYCDTIFLPEMSTALTPKPKYFIIMKDNFPETATGKPDKQLLKRMAEDMFGYSGK
ncbi:3-[(3aS,4S,7aS)-7a-methyl-1,5-dioxo-octahydro-1H-inden-4-yl]propanoyl:CoA ligase [Biomphalaria glabrata]|nr:3-[(3aS,4S,7aS)-7a-methyl-1,5-dioxo-octahydro-1H-inden-4-yl]propanoyl:CoA ligase [Biomphalaria glabrata]